MKNFGLRTRILIFALVPAVTMALLLTGYYTLTRLHELDQALLERGTTIVRQLAPASEYGVFSGNKAFLVTLVNSTIEERDVRAVAITDSEGQVLARNGPGFRSHASPSSLTMTTARTDEPGLATESPGFVFSTPSRDGLSVVFYAPVLQNRIIVDEFGGFSDWEQITDSGFGEPGKQLGLVSVELSRTATLLKKDQVLRDSLLITLSLLAISTLTAARLLRRVTSPIIRLSAAVEKLERGELTTRVEQTSEGELGTLEKVFNMMALTLQTGREDHQERIDQATLGLRETLNSAELQNAQLAVARKQALAASDVKSEFLANMSHEIRTPLNGILGYTKLLLKTALDEEQRGHAQTIERSSETLLGIVNDILDFSKIESGKLELDNVDIPLRDCVEDVLDLIAPDAHEKGLELVCLMYSDVQPVVRGDPARLRQVLANLVSNAVKFTTAGSVVVRIMREDETQGHIVVGFSVSDTGIGISGQDQRRLFQAFSQADENTARKLGSTGLGLVISKKLVERMHGQISLESEKGKGTTVTFTVRCEKSLSGSARPATPPFQGRKALLFESHPITRLALLESLTGWGLEVVDTGATVTLGEAVSKGVSYDIAVLGLSIGVNDIDQTHRLVEMVCQGCDCPVLALANTTEQARLNQLIGKGISACLSKPVRNARLQSQVEVLLTGQPSSAQGPAPGRQGAKPSADLKGVRILVAEDNEVSRRLAAYLLENKGAKVTVAVNGRQALERFAVQDFDIVFMDVHMPEMDGATVTSLIRSAEQGLQHTPVIALTADALEGNRERFLAAGMDDYLSKPMDEKALYAMVEKWVGIGPAAHSGPAAPVERGVRTEAVLDPAVLDWEQTLKVTGGNEQLANELLGMLLQETEDYPDKLQKALDGYQLSAIVDLAHTLAGGAAHCAAQALRASAQRLEQTAAEGNATTVVQALDELNRELERLRQAIDERQSAA